jgi:DNA-binding transcriptional ArsR family regulator
VRDTEGIIRALNARTRREILSLVWDREMTVGDIAAAFPFSAPTISQHLSVLRRVGLVTMRPDGNSRLYRARPEALEGLHGALEGTEKWVAATAIPETELTEVRTHLAVEANVEVAVAQRAAFRAFTDDKLFSAWMGVPVHIRDGSFSATLEWGTVVKGRYELVKPPDLIVMAWDFEDDNVPVPGREMTAYLRVRPLGGHRCDVTVHQLVDTSAQAEFMQAAWGLVLGRLKEGVAAALKVGPAAGPRPARAKRPE